MKAYNTVILAMAVLWNAADAFGAEMQPLPIDADSKAKLMELATQRSVRYPPPGETFLVEDNLGQDFPISQVPREARESAIGWMQKLVRQEWLPNDVGSLLYARKDAQLREHRNPNTGRLMSTTQGDVIYSEYEMRGHRFMLIETGGWLTVRVQLPSQFDTARDPASKYLELISKFFVMPSSAVSPESIVVERDGPIVAFYRGDAVSSSVVQKRALEGGPVEWWFLLRGYSDGKFLVVSIPEISGKPGSLSSMVGLPDRF